MSTATKPPSRRALFGAGAALIVGGAIATTANAAPAGADAELIALCAAFDRIERKRVAILNDPATPEDDAIRDALVTPLHNEQDNLGPKIWATPATTLEGIQAKARTVTLWAPHFADGPRGWDDEFVASILRDLLAGGAVA